MAVALPVAMTNEKIASLKGRYLAHCGYVCSEFESAVEAFDRLRTENLDFLPSRRSTDSLWTAIEDVLERSATANAEQGCHCESEEYHMHIVCQG